MDYREIFRKYKDGTASDEERQLAEDEIRKFEAIEEFLISEAGEGFSVESESREDDELLSEETKRVKNTIEKRLRKIVVESVIAVMVIFAVIFFVISPLMDTMYYNPASKNLDPENGIQNINYDIGVLTELNNPEKSFLAATADKLGFAGYNISYILQESFSGNYQNINQKISMGRNLHSDLQSEIYTAGIESPLFPEIIYGADSDYAAKKLEVQLQELKKLNENNCVSLAVSLKTDITPQKLTALKERYPDISFNWAAIRTSEYTEDDYHFCIGTKLEIGGQPSKALNEKYPALSSLLWFVDSAGGSYSRPSEERVIGIHYKSMLQYLIDRKEMITVLDESPSKYEFYKAALEYAEKNCIKIYGILVSGEAKAIREFVEDENVSAIEIRKVTLSKFSS